MMGPSSWNGFTDDDLEMIGAAFRSAIASGDFGGEYEIDMLTLYRGLLRAQANKLRIKAV